MKEDPLVHEGLVKDWEIKELDLLNAERSDELELYKRYWINYY